ncbi:MAG: chemotaxis protein CheW [Candidatus Methylumidiphilus sp.]
MALNYPKLKHKETVSMPKEQPIQSSNANLEFLAFTLGDEEYGVEILKVKEIRDYETVTKIANTPEFIKGVINLRGAIVPIVDMRIKFNLVKFAYDQFTVVIVLNIAGRFIGIVVDGVSDVISLTPEQVRPPPDLSARLDTRYIIGLGALEKRMIILTNIERLMSSEEMSLFDSVIA